MPSQTPTDALDPHAKLAEAWKRFLARVEDVRHATEAIA
jgi:hypothetical protein